MNQSQVFGYVGQFALVCGATMLGMYLYNQWNKPKVVAPSTVAAQTTATS